VGRVRERLTVTVRSSCWRRISLRGLNIIAISRQSTWDVKNTRSACDYTTPFEGRSGLNYEDELNQEHKHAITSRQLHWALLTSLLRVRSIILLITLAQTICLQHKAAFVNTALTARHTHTHTELWQLATTAILMM
jgi:hypothetical protein